MFKHIFENIPGLEGYAVFTLLFFFIFFAGIIYWVFRADKSYIQKMKNMPLDNFKNHGEQQDG